MRKEKSKRRQVLGSIGSTVILIVLIVLAITVVVNRDKLSVDNMRRAMSYRNLGSTEQAEEFMFSDHTSNTFALLDDGIAVASASGLSYYDRTGEIVYAEFFSMDSPLIAAGGDRVLAYDSGGTALCVGDSQGILLDMEQTGEIIDAGINENGWLTVCTEEVGTKGRVTVYTAGGDEAYVVDCRTGYLMQAALSSDNSTLAILLLTDTGSKVLWYTTDAQDPQGEIDLPDELFHDIWFTSGSRLAAISNNAVVWLSSGGEQDRYDYADRYLRDYSYSEGDLVLYLSQYKSSQGGALVYLSGGDATDIETEREVLDLSMSGRYWAVLYTGGLDIYRAGDLYAEAEETEGMTRILMRSDGTAFRLSSYRAKLIVP